MKNETIYKTLASRIDALPSRTPRNDVFDKILRVLYKPDEAELLIKMPWGFNNLDNISAITGTDKVVLEKTLNDLADRGVMMDFPLDGQRKYMLPPFVVGFYEFTLMRTGKDANTKEIAKLYKEYMFDNDTYLKANLGSGEKSSAMRTIPIEETIVKESSTQILDYESARRIIENQERFAVGICACRNKNEALGARECDAPMDSCYSFGVWADFMIKHHFCREITKDEALKGLEVSRKHGLVINIDNVKDQPGFMCHCCKCCCTGLLGISKLGYMNTLRPSNFHPVLKDGNCNGCGSCEKECPIGAVLMIPDSDTQTKRKQIPAFKLSNCLGCGVCASKCKKDAIALFDNPKKEYTPTDAFEKLIFAAIERGVLQFQLFNEPNRFTHKILRGIAGFILNLSFVKKLLLGETYRPKVIAFLRAKKERKIAQELHAKGIDQTEKQVVKPAIEHQREKFGNRGSGIHNLRKSAQSGSR